MFEMKGRGTASRLLIFLIVVGLATVHAARTSITPFTIISAEAIDIEAKTSDETSKRASEHACFPDYDTSSGKDLGTCCWYSPSCCSTPDHVAVVEHIKANLSSLQESLGLSDNCYFAIADLMCVLCAPDTARFLSGPPSQPRLTVCRTFCDKLYDACQSDLPKMPFIALGGARDGPSMCKALWAAEEQVTVTISNATGSCFEGASLKQVAESKCLPGYNGSTSDGGDGSSDGKKDNGHGDDKFTKADIAIVVVVVVVVTTVVSASVLLAIWLVRRRRESNSSGISMVVDTDDSFTIPLEAFGDNDDDGRDE